MKLYKKKIFPFRIDDHCSIAFAFAGHEGNAKMVIQDSREAIAEMSPAQRTLKAVRQQLRSFVKSVNHDYVCPDHGGFDLIVALWLGAHPKARLLATSGSALIDVYDYECFGTGSYLGHFLIRPSFDICPMHTEHALLLAARTLAAAKRHDEGCGGISMFWLLRDDGTFLRSEYNIFAAEMYIAQAEAVARDLVLNIGNTGIDDTAFEMNCRSVVQMARTIRSNWKGNTPSWQTLDKLRPALPEEVTEEAL
jgi:20S proteasome alpha/beta subunit